MFDTLYAQMGGALLLLVCAYAWFLGGRAERVAGVAFVLAWLASLAAQDRSAPLEPMYAVLAVDVAVLITLAVLAWKADRSWPAWACAFQLVTVAVHLAYAFDLRLGQWVYWASITVATWGVLVALAVGTTRAWRIRQALAR